MTTGSELIFVGDGILEVADGELRLVGSRCRACDAHVFPAQESCPRCAGMDVERMPLHPQGTLWTFTIQAFPPKAPPYLGPVGEDFTPFAIGYVELEGQLKVEARLACDDTSQLRIGQPMRLVAVPLGPDAEGRTLTTFGFEPQEDDR